MRFLAVLALALTQTQILAAQADSATLFHGIQARGIGPAGMSGRVAAIEAVESNPNIMYVGAATGGVWKSTNGGTSWKPVFDGERTSSIGAIAVFNRSPDIVWVGTGEANPRNSAGVGYGVYRSIDGGTTWTHLGLNGTEHISKIVLHPDNPDIAYVAALGREWGESDERGVYKTTDGGKTWRKVLYVNERTGAADMDIDPMNPDKIFVAMWEYRRWPWFFKSGGAGSGLYLTRDGGEHWQRFTERDGMPAGELGRIGVAVARNRPDVVYALVEARKSALVRSDDGGRSWKVVNDSVGIASRPFYFSHIRVDPTNENRIYNLYSLLSISEDGGRSFRVFLPFSRVHPDYHAMWIHPNGKLMLVGNDGGIAISRDGGGSWRIADNLPLAQFYHINVDMEHPFNVYGGLQDNGSWRGPSEIWENGGIRNYHWMEIGFGDGFAALVDPSDATYAYAMSQGGNLFRTDLRTGVRKTIRPWAPDSVDLRFNWNAGFATDPFDPAVIYYGSQFVHRSPDRGDSWEIISPDLTSNDPEKQRQKKSGGLTRDVTAAENHTTILTIAPSPVARGMIWVGTDDGKVQLTRDGGKSWADLSARIPNVPAGTWVPHIEASKFDSASAFVIMDDHRRSNWTTYIFKTTDFGRHWENIATDDIWGFAHVLEQDPVDPDLLFVGTEFGLYITRDGGRTWHKWTHGLPTVPVRALMVHPRDHDLVIGTHGRAAYIIDDIRPFREMSPRVRSEKLHLFTIPAAYEHTRRQSNGYRFVADGMFLGQNRPYGALLTFYIKEGNDSARVKVAITDSTGGTVISWEVPGKYGVNRVAWNLAKDGPPRLRGPNAPPAAFQASGPQVLPGRYTVKLTWDDTSVTGIAEVLPDPRREIPIAERIAKSKALDRAIEDITRSTGTLRKLRNARRQLDRVIELLHSRKDSVSVSLKEDAQHLEREVTALRDVFVNPPGRPGIYDSSHLVDNMLRSAYRALNSSPDAPTQAQLKYLEQAERALQQALSNVNDLFSQKVADLAERLKQADIELLEAGT